MESSAGGGGEEWMDWSGAHLITPNPLGELEDSGPDLREGIGKGVGGELAAYQSGCQAVGHRAKRGKQATRWKSQVSEANLFHRTAPQYPRLSWNAF